MLQIVHFVGHAYSLSTATPTTDHVLRALSAHARKRLGNVDYRISTI